MVVKKRRLCATCEKPIPQKKRSRRAYCSDLCATKARSYTSICCVCEKEFKTHYKDTLTCGRVCENKRRYSSQLAWRKRKQDEALALRKRKRCNHLDDVPNPFAGALTDRERAELKDRLKFIRAYTSCQGRNIDDKRR